MATVVLLMLSLVHVADIRPAHAQDWYETAGWKFRQKITVPAAGIVGTHVDFPVFVDLSAMDPAFFLKVRPDGGDIRVTRGDGTTEIPREVVFVDVDNRVGEIHFRAPTLSTNLEDREYFVYFGNELAGDYGPDHAYGQRAVWRSGYVGVFHKQATGAVVNSVEDNSGTVIGGVTEGPGYMGGALHYDGESGSYVAVPHSALLDVTGYELTMSAWVRPTAIRQNGYILNKRTGVFGYGMGVTNEYDPSQIEPIIDPGPPCVATPNTDPDDLRNLKAWAISNGFTGLSGTPSPCAPTAQRSIGFTYHEPVQASATNIWNYFVSTYDGTDVDDPRLGFYWNAVLADSLEYQGPEHDTAVDPTRLRPTTADLYLGVLTPPGLAPTGLPFVGAIDEVRISSVTRSADWITTEYNNQSDPEGFIQAAPTEAGAGVTLQDLVDITPQGGTLELPLVDPYGIVDPGEPGVYEIDGALVIDDARNITIRGLDDTVTIRQTGTDRVVTVGGGGSCTNEVTFERLTFTGGAVTGSGGGLLVNAGCDVTLLDVTVTGNTATADGGGISVAGTLTAEDSRISGNGAANAGGVSFVTGSVGDFTDVDVTGNTATGTTTLNGRGGGVRINANNGTATLIWIRGSISGNSTVGTAPESGGAGMHIQGNQTGDGALLQMLGVAITGNTSATDGGGVFLGGNVSVAFANVALTGNTATAGRGGGAHFGFPSVADGASLAWIGGSLSGNAAGTDGGGAHLDGPDRTLTMRRVNVSGNTATGAGDAIHHASGIADLEENWWGTDHEDDLADQQAAIEAGVSGTVDVTPWCLFEDCDAALTVVVDGPFGSVTSTPAGIDAAPPTPSTATFEIDHLDGATFDPVVAGGALEVTLTLDPGPSPASSWSWDPAVGSGGEVTLGPALSSGPDAYTVTYESSGISVGANGTLLSGTDLTRVANGSQAATITVQLRDENGVSIPQAGVDVTFATTLGTLSSPTATTDAGGAASVTLTSTVAGPATVTATVDDDDDAGTPQVAVTNGSPVTVTFTAQVVDAGNSSTGAAPTSVVADGSDTSTLTITVRDAADVAIEGLDAGNFAFVATGPLFYGGPAEIGPGVYTFTVSSTAVGDVDLQVEVNGVMLAAFPTLTFTPAPIAPTNDVPPSLPPGTPTVGVPLTVSPGEWSGLPAPTLSYQWLRCDEDGDDCVEIPGATDPTYVPTADDVDHTLRVRVTATNGVEPPAVVTTNASDPVVPAPPVPEAPTNATPPSISGMPQVGNVLTANPGVWTGMPAPTFSYQWYRCSPAADATDLADPATSGECVPVGTDAVTYTPAGTDVGGRIVVVVTASNSEGADSAASAPAGPVVSAPDPGDSGSDPEPPPAPAPVPVPGENHLPSPPSGQGEASVGGQPAPLRIVATDDGIAAETGTFRIELTLVDRHGNPTGWVDGTALRVLSSSEMFLHASGLQPGSLLYVWLFSEPVLLGELRADGTGVIERALLLLPDHIHACDHTLQVVGTAADGRQVALSLGISLIPDPFPFDDVPFGFVHAAAIGCAHEREVVAGFPDGDFRPAGSLTRGQLMSMLHQILRPSDPPAGGPAFTDLAGNVHADAIRALAGRDLVRGHAGGTFRPDEHVTRGQFSSVIAAAMQLDLSAPVTQAFPDIPGSVHAAAIDALHHAGVLTGQVDGRFHPDQPISRAQATSILMRYVATLD